MLRLLIEILLSFIGVFWLVGFGLLVLAYALNRKSSTPLWGKRRHP
jgi:hypothetical protein